MKNVLKVLFVVSLVVTGLFGRHLPFCEGHSTGECHGYAMAKAFGRDELSECCASTLTGINDINPNYFVKLLDMSSGIPDIILAENLRNDDIINWSDHSAVVTQTGTNIGEFRFDHKTGSGSMPVLTGRTLSQIKSDMSPSLTSNPTKIYRKISYNYDITVQNNFESGEVGFKKSVYSSGSTVTGLNWEWEYQAVAVEDGTVPDGETYKKIFKYWNLPLNLGTNSNKTTDILIIGTPSETRVLTAHYNNEYEINCYNSFSASQQSGKMKVNGVIYNNIVSASPILTEQYTPISLEAIDQYDDGIEYHFDHWDNQSTSKSRTFTPIGNQIVTAYFSAHRPENVSGIQVVSGYGENVELSWNEHENDDCSYRIYRKVKDDQGNVTESLVATRSHSSTSWTDMSYTKEVSGQVLWYDVRAYYNGSISMDYQEAPAGWDVVLYGDSFRSEQKPNIDTKSLAIIPENNATVYPNPFNATTIISYNIKDNSVVSLKIFDISGKEVKSIENGYKNKGTYRHTWDGCDNQGNLLPTGLYFYHLVANNKSESFKKTGKILMVK